MTFQLLRVRPLLCHQTQPKRVWWSDLTGGGGGRVRLVECYNCQFVVVSLIVSQRAFEVSQRASKTSQQSQPASKAGEATRQHAKPANQSAAVLRTIGGSAKRTSWLGCVIWYSRYCDRGEVPPPITASVTARAHVA